MAYDEQLAERIRLLVAGESRLSEQKMFGGLAFLIGGHMAVAASGQGGLMVRVDPAASDELVAGTSAQPMVMRGREMTGWLRVDADAVVDESELQRWVRLGTGYARSLPPKQGSR
jgi:TfoX/Sxy family transcriptional regulator of competence genes